MIPKCICQKLLTFRSVYFHSQMNCSIKLKLHLQQDYKLFHVASVKYKKKSYHSKTPKKDYKDKKPIKVWENITVNELASAMNVDFNFLKSHYSNLDLTPETKLKSLKFFAPLAHRLGLKFEIVKELNEEQESKDKFVFNQLPSKPENLIKRPPIVTVMGHVDHGKTTLLDSLRNSCVTEQEFGGITQHIGAFSVVVKSGEKITFIDTPGHAAFTAMRTRGAETTDIVVLVIAADDGVMKQTVESIRIALAAQVHLIIAVNKIDKPTALPMDDIKKKLLEEGIQVEDMGGEIQLVPISALKKINLDVLTEVILLEAELMNLKGDPTGFVEGFIIESKKDKLGMVATLIVKRGTLQKGKFLVAGVAYAKVRRMLDEHGRDYKEALPSTPVQVFGWRELPLAGDKVFEVPSEKEATAFIRENQNEIIMEKQMTDEEIIKQKLSMDQEKHFERKKILKSAKSSKERRRLFFKYTELERLEKIENADPTPHLNVVIKGDVYGTLEVLEDILRSYDKEDECHLNVIEASVGDIKENDLKIAEITNAIIYAFNVNLNEAAVDLVKGKNVDIRFHNVIYKLVDDLKEELDKRIPDVDEEKIIVGDFEFYHEVSKIFFAGEAEVLQNFIVTYSSKKVPVAGAKCTQGQLKDNLYKVLRNEEVIYRGKLKEMRHEKKVVKTISKGIECGILLDSFPDKFLPGDKIICYEMIKVTRKSTWNPGF